MTFDIETFGALAILAFFAFVIWRGGSANPVGTGQLQRQLNTIGAEVTTLKKTVSGCASVGAIEQLRSEMREMEARVASSGEVVKVQAQVADVNGKVSAIDARLDGIEKLADRTDAGVQRIEGYFLQRGVNR